MLQLSKKKTFFGGNCEARDELHSGMIRDTARAKEAVLFSGLSNPFYAVDNREYQVVHPDVIKMSCCGAKLLAIEKERLHVPLERAVMAIRFNEEMIGTQFHPEADREGMLKYLHGSEKKEMVIRNYGEEKWLSMIEQLNDPEKIEKTYSTLLPHFLQSSLKA